MHTTILSAKEKVRHCHRLMVHAFIAQFFRRVKYGFSYIRCYKSGASLIGFAALFHFYSVLIKPNSLHAPNTQHIHAIRFYRRKNTVQLF